MRRSRLAADKQYFENLPDLRGSLPLRLQDLSLLFVVNDLDSYPVDLLGSLPRHLRHRLLHNLPALDLCHLDGTLVTKGIDMDEIWKTRWTPYQALKKRILCQRFEVNSGYSLHSTDMNYYIERASDVQDLEPELIAAFKTFQNGFSSSADGIVNGREEYLMMVALIVLYNSLTFFSEYEYLNEYRNQQDATSIWQTAAKLLVSVKGDLLLQDVTEATHERYKELLQRTRSYQPKVRYDYHWVWKIQGIPLAKSAMNSADLTPHRYLQLRATTDCSKIISLLINDCKLQPSSIDIDVCKLRRSHIAQIDDLLQHLMRKVVILGLTGTARLHSESLVSVLSIIAEALPLDCSDCQLRAIYCDPPSDYKVTFYEGLSPYFFTLPGTPGPPRYQDLSVLELHHIESHPYLTALLKQQRLLKYVTIQLDAQCTPNADFFVDLSLLFTRPQFQVLHLDAVKIESYMLYQLLQGFMTAPCSCTHQLTISVESQISSSSSQLIAPNSGMANASVSSCALQHKRLAFCSRFARKPTRGCTGFMDILFQLPTVRLRNIQFDCWTGKEHPYLHLAALHPDFQVAKLVLKFVPDSCLDTAFDLFMISENEYEVHTPTKSVQDDIKTYHQTFLRTVESDVRTLFKMSTLEEVVVTGRWIVNAEVKQAVLCGLQEQSQVGSLRKITLIMSKFDETYTEDEFKQLWNVIFSFPQLSQLEMVVQYGHYKQVETFKLIINNSWRQFASGQQPKSLQFIMLNKREQVSIDMLPLACHI